MSGLQIHQFPALKDNYGFLLRDSDSGKVATIDTPDAETIAQQLALTGWGRLDYILNTHWHADHTGGNAALKAQFECAIYGPPEVMKSAPLDHVLAGGDLFAFGATLFDVLDLKGHTLGHIGYSAPVEKVAFVGDTLFPLGCGRLFEGTPEDMWASLSRLIRLDLDTRIFSAHEYTLGNLAFAQSLGADDRLNARARVVMDLRDKGLPTVPARLSDEIETNPFLVHPLKETGITAQAARFAEIRAAKDIF